MKKKVIIGLIGVTLDNRGFNSSRWDKWRPTISLFQHEELLIDRFELLYQFKYESIANQIISDAKTLSPETKINKHEIQINDPWDLEEVYNSLYDFALGYNFKTDEEEYFLHITTGTHISQICMYLLTEARFIPAKFIQSSPKYYEKESASTFQIIDLDLSKYDSIANRFNREKLDGANYLKSGIQTQNKLFNNIIEQIEHVAVRSQSPILLFGPTGAGKTLLARKIFELKKQRRQVNGEFIEINCATLRGDLAMSTLFGHKKGSFTGANSDRNGLLHSADQGVLFLDEIGDLGIDEQTMLLRALEDKRFLPLGADKEVYSDFQLIAGTNKDLYSESSAGKFRDDLLARINLWTYTLPGLKSRKEDIDPNIEFELEKFSQNNGRLVRFNNEAKKEYSDFAKSNDALWKGNFRDLNSSIVRMATLSDKGRITIEIVNEEIVRLKNLWHLKQKDITDEFSEIRKLIGEKTEEIDLFDRFQLNQVIKVCRNSQTVSNAGRQLFHNSMSKKQTNNDADRLRKYLNRFGINWEMIKESN